MTKTLKRKLYEIAEKEIPAVEGRRRSRRPRRKKKRRRRLLRYLRLEPRSCIKSRLRIRKKRSKQVRRNKQ